VLFMSVAVYFAQVLEISCMKDFALFRELLVATDAVEKRSRALVEPIDDRLWQKKNHETEKCLEENYGEQEK
jgi:hypothetical protein